MKTADRLPTGGRRFRAAALRAAINLSPGFMPARLFCSYSHKDRELKENLSRHLSPLMISDNIVVLWSDDHLLPGEEFDPRIKDELDRSNVILLLISANYFSSHYCWHVEAMRAFERHESTQATVVPILIKDVAWESTTINKLTVLPRNLKPITSWANQDEAFKNVVVELSRVIESALHKPLPTDVRPTVAADDDTGNGKFYCTAEFQGPDTMVRAAGVTELLPDLYLRFRGDLRTRLVVDIWLFANTNITSPILNSSNLSEITLSLATSRVPTQLPVLGRGVHAVQSGVNSVTFLGVPLHELAALRSEERIVRISGVRVNSLLLALGRTAVEQSRIWVNLRLGDIAVRPKATISAAPIGGDLSVSIESAEPTLDLMNLSRTRFLNKDFLDDLSRSARLTLILRCAGFLSGPEDRGRRTRLMLSFRGVASGVSLFVTIEPISSAPQGVLATLTETDENGCGSLTSVKSVGYVDVGLGPPRGWL